MRFGELVSRVLAAGMFVGLGAQAAMAGDEFRQSTGSPERPGLLRPGCAIAGAARAPGVGRRRCPGSSPCRTTVRHTAPPRICCRQSVVARASVAVASKAGSLTDFGPHPLGEPRAVALGGPCRAAPAIEAGGEGRPHEGKIPVLEDPSLRALEHALKARSAHRPEAPPCFGAQEASQRAKSAGDFEAAEPETDVGALDGSAGFAGLRRTERSKRLPSSSCRLPTGA